MVNWKEVARDLLALGSIPFYAIVIVRMLLIKEITHIVPQLVVALFLVFISLQFIKFDYHLAQGFILVVFTSLAYKELIFTVFASLLFIGMLYSANYLKMKRKLIINGTVVGVISSIIAYYSVILLF